MAFAKETQYFFEKSSTIEDNDHSVYNFVSKDDNENAYHRAYDFLEECKGDGNASTTAAAMITLAHVQLLCNDSDRAMTTIEKACEKALEAGSKKLQAAATNIFAKILLWTSPEEAMAKAQEASTFAVASGDPCLRALIYHTLASGMIAAGMAKSAAGLGSEMLSLFESSSDSVAQGCALVCASGFAAAAEEYKTALKHAKDAAEKFEAIGDVAKEALATSSAAKAAFASKELSHEGEYLADKALTLFNRVEDKKGPIAVKLVLAEHKLKTDEFIAAEDLAEEAVKACQEDGDEAQEAEALQVLATIRLELAIADANESKEDLDTASATESARYALAAFRKLDNRHGEAKASYKLSQIRYHAGAYDAAKMGAEEAQLLYKELGDMVGEADTMLLVANVQMAEDQFDSAKRQATKALNLYQRVGHETGMKTVDDFLTKCKSKQSEKARDAKTASKADGSTTKTGLVKLVNNAEEASHLLSYFAEMNDDEDTELTEFDLSAWGDSILSMKA